MYQEAGKQSFFDLIDVDPYGSASPFLDAAVQAVSSGGLLAITSTDMAVLCGVHPGTCFAKYQGVPLHSDYSQEMVRPKFPIIKRPFVCFSMQLRRPPTDMGGILSRWFRSKLTFMFVFLSVSIRGPLRSRNRSS